MAVLATTSSPFSFFGQQSGRLTKELPAALDCLPGPATTDCAFSKSHDCKGRSEKSHDPDSYGVIMVDDVVRLLDHLRIEQAHVVTYSMGGYIAIKMATLYPERIKSLVLGGAGWIDAQWDVLESAWEDQANELESEGVDAGDNDPLALAAVLRKEYELRVDEEDFRNWDMPTLAVIGNRDFLLPGVKALVRAVPHITVEILPGHDHQSALGDPQFATAVRGFLAAESAR